MNHMIHYEYKLNYNTNRSLMQRIGAAVMDINRAFEQRINCIIPSISLISLPTANATIPQIPNIPSLSTATNEIVPSISSISSISLPLLQYNKYQYSIIVIHIMIFK
eukprot:222191_1